MKSFRPSRVFAPFVVRRMEFKDYYATLGVNKTATEKEIKQAFRKLARKHHPDVNPGDKAAESRFKEINEAYEVLGDPAKRKKYDELGANWRMYEQAEAQGGPNPFAGGVERRHGRLSGGGFRTMTQEEMEEMFGDQNPFSDFFTTFFGGGGFGARAARAGARRGRGACARARDATSSTRLSYRSKTPTTALRGGCRSSTTVTRGPSMCGFPPASAMARGSASRAKANKAVGGALRAISTCACGSRRTRVFERKGRDLYVKVPLPVTTAVLGGEVEVPTIGGKTVRLKIPGLTQNGQMFRLKGYGMPAVGKPEDKGDV